MRKKSDRFLRFIIGYKAFFSIFQIVLSIALYSHLGDTAEETITALALGMNLDTRHTLVSAVIEKAGMIDNGLFVGLTAVLFGAGILNMIEAVGLHLRQRWAEWLTVFATGILIPFELYGVIEKVTVLRVIILVINIAIVYYLAKHKELFGKKRAVKLRLS